MTGCPGCGRPMRDGKVCCDDCWYRLPPKLPVGIDGKQVSWRHRLASWKSANEQAAVDNVHAAILAWLAEHPETVQRGPV
jgi:hypothetical protein